MVRRIAPRYAAGRTAVQIRIVISGYIPSSVSFEVVLHNGHNPDRGS